MDESNRQAIGLVGWRQHRGQAANHHAEGLDTVRAKVRKDRGRDWWTHERILEMQKLTSEGMSAGLVGAQMGKTRNAILGIQWRLRNPAPGHTPSGPRPGSPRVPTFTIPQRRHVRKPERSLVVSLPTRAPEGSLAPLCASFSPIIATPLGTPATLMERHPQGCCFPVNDGGPFIYCNSHRLAEFDYCPEHYKLMYSPLPSRKLSQWIKWR